MPQHTGSEQMRLQELLRGLAPGTAQASMGPTAPLPVPPISTSIARTEGEPPTFLERTLKSLSPYFSAMDAKERTKVINKALDLDFKGEGSPLGVKGFSPAAETERREGLVSSAEGPPPPPPGALSSMFQQMRLQGIGQEPGSRGAGITDPGFLSRTMPSGIGLLDAPPPAVPEAAPVPIDPSILAQMQATGRPGGAPPPTPTPPVPIPGMPGAGLGTRGPTGIPMPKGPSIASALGLAEDLLGSEAFQGVTAPDFTSVEEKLEGLKPDAPLLQSFAEKLAGFLGGAASGARGARTFGEALLGAGGGAAQAGAVSSREDQRRKERFEDLDARYTQAEVNLELAQVQAEHDAKASTQQAVDNRQKEKLKLGKEMWDASQPKFSTSGGRWYVTQRNLETGETTVRTGRVDAAGDEMATAIQALKFLKLQQETGVAPGGTGGKPVKRYYNGRMLGIVPGSVEDLALTAWQSDPRVRREGGLRAMYVQILKNPSQFKEVIEKIGQSVMSGTDVYTPEQEALIRSSYKSAIQFSPEIQLKQLPWEELQQIIYMYAALAAKEKAKK